ncbi:hypothetical protein HLRTI_003137 [Halorhabdus tiamatea SARL4B]|nr:hypothetical protein HLRTI_003137 [Halorhabdus tiamatea SARL4B]
MALRDAIAGFRATEFTGFSVWNMVVDIDKVEADDPQTMVEDHAAC